MKILRTLVTALAAVIVAGTVASATPSLLSDGDAEPTPEVSVTPSQTPSPEPTDPPESEPTETPSPSPSASETSSPPGSGEDGDGASAAPDFAACTGLRGLENAICRHKALLAVDGENQGLQNALQRLLDKQAGQEDEAEEPAPDDDGETPDDDGETPDDDGEDAVSCPGHSCGEHGNGNGNGHNPH